MDTWRKSYYERIGAYELTDEAAEYSRLTSKKTTSAQTSSTETISPKTTGFDFEQLKNLNIENFALSADKKGVRGRCILNKSQTYLQKLKEAGIEQIIDLRKEGNTTACTAACDKFGLKYLNFPIEYNSPMTAENIKNLPLFIKAMNDGKYYIGCNMGTHRTDVAIGLSYIFNPDSKVIPTFKSGNSTKAIELLKKACNEILQRNKRTRSFDVPEDFLIEMGWENKGKFLEEFTRRIKLISINNCK